MELYVSLFGDAEIRQVERFGPDEEESGVTFARFRLAGREFRAMDRGAPHAFTFTPALSFWVECGSEAEVERAFAGLSEGGSVLMPWDPAPGPDDLPSAAEVHRDHAALPGPLEDVEAGLEEGYRTTLW
jgi:predicted 3-demethylubiquinone-9 3-methyltransferase (glyoxalase superfamily)